ncbi:hypothetical protein PTI98_013620 [Pleurotus ostreatus]|nr:hypothetical protein PTI98_013620 [Pleurotus ostreatus]
MDHIQQAETRSLQATGKDEEINLFIKMMTDIVALLDDQAAARAVKSGQKQMKEIVENTASSQIRIASMKGLVRGESMVDVSSLPGASVREKQAQRGVKRRAVSLSNGDKENHAPGVLPRKRRHSEYQRLLMEQIEHEKQELDDLRARDEQRHNEMVALQQQTIETLSNVTSLLEAQQQHEIERRNEQVARNLQEKEQQAALTAAILTLSLNLSKSK